jgi:hypothetical protein
MRKYLHDYRQKARFEAIQLLGGGCKVCGTKGSPENWLEFHYKAGNDPAISDWDRIGLVKENPEAFELRCRFHHLQYHAEQIRRNGGRVSPSEPMELAASMKLARKGGPKRRDWGRTVSANREKRRSLNVHGF